DSASFAARAAIAAKRHGKAHTLTQLQRRRPGKTAATTTTADRLRHDRVAAGASARRTGLRSGYDRARIGNCDIAGDIASAAMSTQSNGGADCRDALHRHSDRCCEGSAAIAATATN